MKLNQFKDFVKFLKSPDDVQFKRNIKQKLIIVLTFLVFEVIFSYIIIFPLFDSVNTVLQIKGEKFDYTDTILKSIIFWVILVPLIEEFFFRYFLRYQGFKIKIINRSKWDKIFPFLVYLFAVGFGVAHLTNYLNDDKLFYILAPFIILSQIIGSLIITYIRVRLNFRWAVLYHWTWNFLFLFIVPFIESGFEKPFIEKTTDYSIAIEEQLFFYKKNPQTIEMDSADGKIYSFRIEQYSLQHILDTLYRKETYYTDDVLLKLNFNSKKGINKQEFLKILKKDYDIK